MNAEQLHAVAKELQALVNESRVVNSLQELQSSLHNLVKQPQQPQHQTQIQNIRRQLIDALETSDFNNWSMNKHQIASEIGAAGLFGKALAKRIEDSFEANAATPEVIRQEIENAQNDVAAFSESLKKLTSAFETFNIEFEALEPGEGEIGILIPRSVNAGLYDFSKDLRRIDFELKTLAQVVTGSAENFSIRTISSSDLMVFLAAIPELVNFFSNIVVSLRLGYEKAQELKEVLEKMRNLGNTSEATIESLEGDVESAMEKEVAKVIEQIRPMYETAVANGLAEDGFEVSLTSTVKAMAARIDRGYSFSFRIGPPTVVNEEEPTPAEQAQLTAATNVANNNERIQQLKMIEPGQQVLPLEWQTSDPEEDQEG